MPRTPYGPLTDAADVNAFEAHGREDRHQFHNPHTHVVLRGKDDTGKDLVISQTYINRGMRERAAELSTEWLATQGSGSSACCW